MTLLENITQTVAEAVQVENTPPHVGEVMNLWTYYTAVQAVLATNSIATNHTNNPDLKRLLEHLITDVLASELKQLSDVMKDKGISFSARPPEVPKADVREIPAGVQLADMTIANRLVADLEGLIIAANVGLLQSIRNDIGATFLTFHGDLVVEARKVKAVMEQHGWLQVPPSYYGGQGPAR